MTASLVGFIGDAISVEGVIELAVVAGKAPTKVMVSLRFLGVRTLSACNVILERPGLNALWTVVSTYHLLVKFPTRVGVRKSEETN